MTATTKWCQRVRYEKNSVRTALKSSSKKNIVNLFFHSLMVELLHFLDDATDISSMFYGYFLNYQQIFKWD